MEQTPLKPQLEAQLEYKESAIEEPSKYITVTCRLKPLLSQEEKSKIEVDRALHQITISDPSKSINKAYTFDRVFDETVCQDRFAYSICDPVIKFLKNGGESSLIFSYGITNSGKTYTILGTKDQPGILLTLMKKLEHEFPYESFNVVACELYKDEFISLKNKGEKLHPKEFKGILSFDDCDSDVVNESNMGELFEKYLQNRSCGSNFHNSHSSRSHAIFKITCRKFKIGIVDLAGSERTSKNANDTNVDKKQTIFINQSLLTLKKCIKILEERSTAPQKLVVPYRESKLTQALMEYFIYNSKINIIVNINQARNFLEQNLNAMDYTSKAKNITANATSDFSKMLKSTAKKKNQAFSSFKPKLLSQSAREAEKRYSANMIESGERFIIDEELLDAEDPEESLEREIEEQARRSEIMRRQSELMFQQIVRPVTVEEFCERQRLFREVYLTTEMQIEREADERKLSALRKVNLMETTEKKPESKQTKRRLVNPVDTTEVGTEILGGQLISESDELNEKLAKIEFQKLKTEVKKKLMRVLDEEKRKQLVDVETMWSERKSQTIQKLERNKIQESVTEEEESNYTTPGKKPSKGSKSVQKLSKSFQRSIKKPNIFSVVASGAKSAVNGITSCVKSGAKLLGFGGKSIAKSHHKGKQLKPKAPRFNMQLRKELEILIEPSSRICYEIATETEVEIVASSRKINVLERQPVMNADGEIEIDVEPVIVEKEVVLETFEVGIQTEEIEVKYLLQDVLDKNVEELKQKNKNNKNGKNMKKKQKPHSIFSEESTVHEDEEEDTVESPGEKLKHEEKQKNKKGAGNQKTVFKNFSLNKRNVEMSVGKHKALISAAKTGIAKHTRGAQKKKVHK